MAAAIGEPRIEIELKNYRMRSIETLDLVEYTLEYTLLKDKDRNIFCVSLLNDRKKQLDG